MDDARFTDPVLDQWQEEAKARAFPVDKVAAWYQRIEDMRGARADYYERALIRYLKYGLGLTWQQVAEAINDPHLSSRQAAHAKWGRLLDEQRGGRSDGWPKGRRRTLDDGDTAP